MNDDNPQPLSTYRLQFNREFRFEDAQKLVPYFSRLGVTHLYSSPILRSRQSSTHGYDVVDPNALNPNLGDKTDLVDLVTDLRNFGLGMILDIVPNHMAASIENPYWRDVLTYGPSSPFAGWFDVDWRMPDPDMWGRVLAPVLGEPRSRVLKQDQIRLIWADGRFLVQYFEHLFPVDPATVPMICQFGLKNLKQSLGDDHPVFDRIREILAHLKKLPKPVARLRRRVNIDREETEQWLSQFAQLVVQSPRIQEWAEDTAEKFGQGEEGHRRLKKLLDRQPYRLVHWRAAARTVNYRRFFDINELISVRQEDPHVFEETHATVLRWIEGGLFDGLRIDHIDGLRDPLAYLERLAEALANADRPLRPVPIFVEKILAPGEPLPCGWPVAGTTGYEFLNQVEAIFISPEGFAEIETQYRRMLRRPAHFSEVAAWGKRRVLRNDLSPQVGRLADLLLRLAESHSQPASVSAAEQDNAVAAATPSEEQSFEPAAQRSATPMALAEPTKREFVDALVEVITALPIYRTYVDGNHGALSDADREYIKSALEAARESERAPPEAVDFVGEVLLLDNKADLPEHELHERVSFIQRFQQLTGPAAAKGIEDTALYAYVPLASLNEVGGEPELPTDGCPTRRLHAANEERSATHPRNMLCVTTHDTKRTADVRARLDVLSELPMLWSGLVRRWQRTNQPHRPRINGKPAPDAATEYLFYQTVVGLWPAPHPDRVDEMPAAEALQDLRERIEGYMLKAIREAKTQTSWTRNNEPFEEAVLSFVRSLLLPDEAGGNAFLSDVQHLVARIVRPGFWNSLSRTLVQFTAPGTPDLYQGDELWNFALVDPDNRRPVDYERRIRLLDEIITAVEGPDEARRAIVRDMVNSPEDGRIKLHTIHSALVARREFPDLFTTGRYLPLDVGGTAADHVFAYARVDGPLISRTEQTDDDRDRSSTDVAAIVVVPRLTTGLLPEPAAAPVGEAVWSDTVIPLPEQLKHRQWTSVLTGERVDSTADGELQVASVLQSFPVELLIGDSLPAVH